MSMTVVAQQEFIAWAEKHTHAQQRVLTAAIEDSKEKDEQINADIAKEIIAVVESIIKEKKI